MRRMGELLCPHPIEKERPCRIVAAVSLAVIDYENFLTDLLADRQFIEEPGGRCKRGDVWACLFVRRRGQPDGVLIPPEQACFVGWAAYIRERIR